MTRAYPPEVSARLTSRWIDGGPSDVQLPATGALQEILESAYHASFLHEELRPLRFRLLVAAPTTLPTCQLQAPQLQFLEFDPSRRLS